MNLESKDITFSPSIERYLTTSARILSHEARIKDELPHNITVSVVIPAFQESGGILQTLMSLNEQSNHSFEVIVVDNGSTDGTKDIVYDFRENSKYPLYLIEEATPGPGEARKTGMDEVVRRYSERYSGKDNHFLVTTDADTLFPQEWIENTLNLIRQGYGAVGGAHSGQPWIDGLIKEQLGIPDYFLNVARLNLSIVQNGIGKPKMSGPNSAFSINAYVEAGGIRQPYDQSGKILLKEAQDLTGRIESKGFLVKQTTDIVRSSRRRHLTELIKGKRMYYSEDSRHQNRFLTIRGNENLLLEYALEKIPKNVWKHYQLSLMTAVVINTIIEPLAQGRLDQGSLYNMFPSIDIRKMLLSKDFGPNIERAWEEKTILINCFVETLINSPYFRNS